MSFGDRLAARSPPARARSCSGSIPTLPVCGPTRLARSRHPAPPRSSPRRPSRAHCAALIDAAARHASACKPQLACFERLGAPGWTALAATVDHARDAGLLVILDAKRGDIDVSAAAYAQGLLGSTPTPFGDVEGLRGDAVTVNPLLGRDSLAPFVDAARANDAGLFVLVRTSNPGAADVQDLPVGDATVHERLAAIVGGLGEPGASGIADVGAVAGATAPEHLARLRELMPAAPFLLPGIGAQGGRVSDLAAAFAPGRAGGLVSASRSIARAHEAVRTRDRPTRRARGRASAGRCMGAVVTPQPPSAGRMLRA